MAVKSYSDLLSRANGIRTSTAMGAVTPSLTGGLLRDIVDSVELGGVFDVTRYAANPANLVAGLDDPTAAFTAAAAAASAVGGTIRVPKGTFGTGADWEFTVPSGVTVEGEGDGSVLVNVWFRVAGSAGSTIPFTGATVKGATSIPIPATGLTDQWLRLSSVINSQSSDAGVDQLGTAVTEASFFGEFARVLSGGASSATLDCRLVFPYSNTPGGDSGSFTTSVARVMTFSQNVRVCGLKLLGHNSTHSETVRIRFARNVIFEDITFDANDQITQTIFADYCLDCKWINCRIYAKRNSVPVNSSTNGIVMVSCQSCIADNCLFLGGYQGIDVSFASNDSTYRGGPSIGSGAVNCTARDNERDGFTSHYGVYGAFFVNCTSFAKLGGIRIRSRGDRVLGCRVFATQAGNYGILIDDAATVDAIVSENYVEGGSEGILYTHSLSGLLPLETLLKCGSSMIKGNTVRGTSDHGIYLNTAYTSAVMVGPKVVENDVHFPTGNGIQINAYNNGTIVERNRISGIGSGKHGIRWEGNIKRLHVGTNWVYDVDAAGFAVSGPSVATMMTDAVTFPAGDAEAFLYVGETFTDATNAFSAITRVPVAYTQPNTAAFGSSGAAARTGKVLRGSGSPEGVHYAPIGTMYQRTDGGAGTSMYVKESAGTSNTGWVAK